MTRDRDSLGKMLAVSFKNPAFWGYSTWLDIVVRYRRASLGLWWIFVPPLLYMLGLGYFYSRLAQRNMLDYIPHLGLGFMLYRLVTTVVIESTSVLPNHSGFILDGKVRLTDFVLRVIFKGVFYFVCSMIVLVPLLLFSPQFHLSGILPSLLGLAFVLANLMWMAGVISLFGARYPDTHEFMGNVFLLGFVITPILWDKSAAPAHTIHGLLMRLNPAFHMIEVVRAPLLGELIEPASQLIIFFSAVFGWMLWGWAFRRYSRFVPLWV